MAARLVLDFNSGTDGATVAAGGSIAAVTGAPVYSTAAAVHGALGFGVTPATNASTFIRVDLGANPVNHSGSVYWHPKTQSASTTTLIRFADSANGNIFSLVQSTTKLIVVDSTSTAQATSTLTWADQVYRIDWQADFTTVTAPVLVVRLFATPEAWTPTETLTPTLTNPSSLVFNRWLVGAVGVGGSSSTRSVLFDTFRVADGAEWLGPFAGTVTPLAVTAAGTTSTGGGVAAGMRTAITATGAASTAGTATPGLRAAVTAAGGATTDGAAAVGARLAVAAAGAAAVDGGALVGATLSVSAAGGPVPSGTASARLFNRLTRRPAAGVTVRPLTTTTTRPYAGTTTRP